VLKTTTARSSRAEYQTVSRVRSERDKLFSRSVDSPGRAACE
jgi:hypothetical protein